MSEPEEVKHIMSHRASEERVRAIEKAIGAPVKIVSDEEAEQALLESYKFEYPAFISLKRSK